MNRTVTAVILIIIISSFQLITNELLAQGNSGNFDLLADKVIGKDLEAVTQLLEQGIDINLRQESSGATVLIIASSYAGYEDFVEYLILHGSEVNLKDNNGKTALIWAASSSVESARILISHGAKVNEKANDGMTAFIQAVFGVSSGKVPLAMCELLRENGADINASLTGASAAGWTALHYAVTNGDVDLVKYLIRYGANVNKATAEGSTPLFLAKLEGYDEIVTMLKKAGAQE